MCRAIEDGGRRCEGHTGARRARYEKAARKRKRFGVPACGACDYGVRRWSDEHGFAQQEVCGQCNGSGTGVDAAGRTWEQVRDAQESARRSPTPAERLYAPGDTPSTPGLRYGVFMDLADARVVAEAARRRRAFEQRHGILGRECDSCLSRSGIERLTDDDDVMTTSLCSGCGGTGYAPRLRAAR